MHPRLGTRCWIWTAGKIAGGYGSFALNHGTVYTHRYSYEQGTGMFWGWFADGEVDHRCHNFACVNPHHLRAASHKQNCENLRGAFRNNKSSGVRGITWDKSCHRWMARVGHNGKEVYVGRFATIAEAEAAVVAKRIELHTHNDVDRGDASVGSRGRHMSVLIPPSSGPGMSCTRSSLI